MNPPRVVIVGGGFAGLAAAKTLAKAEAQVVLIDRANHHLFQPLLYQVATSTLAPGQIATPIREAWPWPVRDSQSCKAERSVRAAALYGSPGWASTCGRSRSRACA